MLPCMLIPGSTWGTIQNRCFWWSGARGSALTGSCSRLTEADGLGRGPGGGGGGGRLCRR